MPIISENWWNDWNYKKNAIIKNTQIRMKKWKYVDWTGRSNRHKIMLEIWNINKQKA